MAAKGEEWIITHFVWFVLVYECKWYSADILPMFHHSLPLQLHFSLNFRKHQKTSQTCYPTFCNNHTSATIACARSGGSRLLLVYWSTLKIANDLPIFASYYTFVIVSLTWSTYFLSHDYLSYINSLGFFLYFLFLSDEGPMLETLDNTIRIGSTPTFLYFEIYMCVCMYVCMYVCMCVCMYVLMYVCMYVCMCVCMY